MAESSQSDDAKRVVAATPARQGRYGKHVFWVLVVSTVLAAIALFFTWTWKAPALSDAQTKVTATRTANAPGFNAPEPAAKQTSNQPPPTAP
jgi:hypothetical protein